MTTDLKRRELSRVLADHNRAGMDRVERHSPFERILVLVAVQAEEHLGPGE